MNYVYSTLSNNNAYAVYDESSPNNAHSVIKRTILIKGGHGVANKNFITPKGVVTEVNDEDLDILMKDSHFKQHMSNGFIKVEKRKMDTEKAIQDMAEKDESAPKTDKDYEKSENDIGDSSKPTVTYRESNKGNKKL